MSQKKLVRDIMVPNVQVVEGNMPVVEAAKLMAQHNIGAIIILSAIKEPLGIFTERDLLKRVVAQGLDPKSTPLSKVMTPKFVCVQASDELKDLPEIMVQGNFRHLPVVEGRKLLGILSIRDIVKYQAGL